ncbi:MAG: cadmium-translocating P-type ATPase, partial [Clostridia bacterium]|nr:cadmium-translocating P-type ATPase [Clostridia bacterium]
ALFETGELFQSLAVSKARRAINALFDIRPDTATVVRDGEEVTAPAEEVALGEVIAIYPGERIPLDGVVISGGSQVDNSALTGESLPVEVGENSPILSGAINLSGKLLVKVTAEFSQSTASRILALVEESSMKKSRQENFIKRFAKIYTPCVCAGALLLATVPPLVQLLMGAEAGWLDWIYRALSFLVISCPCALVISVPLTFFAGLGAGGKKGVLIKGANYLDALSRVDTVVFDKTGTVTEGCLDVKDVYPQNISREDLLYYAAHVERGVSHPLARAIVKAYGLATSDGAVEGLNVTNGRGASAKVGGKFVVVGSGAYFNQRGIAVTDDNQTSVHVAIDGKYAGKITFADRPKAGAEEGISLLRKEGVTGIYLLTGDKDAPAKELSSRLGFDGYKSQLLPAEKVSALEGIMEGGKKGKTVAFVGDGVNDAPALSRADVGIAMGGAGSDGAIESSDVVIMDDDVKKIPLAVRIGKKCLRIVRQNVVFALAVKGACLVLSAFNIASLWMAIFADVGVMILAVLNAMRAFRTKG